MNLRSITRLVAAAIAAPLVSWLAVMLIRVGPSGQATMAGIVNIAYAIALVEHLAMLAVIYGLVVPAVAPGLVARALPSMTIGLSVGVVLFVWMLFRLDLDFSNFDRFAAVATRNAAIGIFLDVTLIYWLGFNNNDLAATHVGGNER